MWILWINKKGKFTYLKIDALHLYKKENIKAEYFVFGRYAVRPIKLWSRKTTVRLKLWSIDWPMNIKQMSCAVPVYTDTFHVKL